MTDGAGIAAPAKAAEPPAVVADGAGIATPPGVAEPPGDVAEIAQPAEPPDSPVAMPVGVARPPAQVAGAAQVVKPADLPDSPPAVLASVAEPPAEVAGPALIAEQPAPQSVAAQPPPPAPADPPPALDAGPVNVAAPPAALPLVAGPPAAQLPVSGPPPAAPPPAAPPVGPPPAAPPLAGRQATQPPAGYPNGTHLAGTHLAGHQPFAYPLAANPAGATNPSGNPAPSPAGATNPAATDLYLVPSPPVWVPPSMPFDWEGRLAAANRGPMAWGIPAFFVGVGGYFLVSLIIAGVVTGNVASLDAIRPDQRGPLLLLLFLPNVLLGVGPAVLSWRYGQGLRRDFGILPQWRDVRIGTACGGVALGVGLLINLLLRNLVYRGGQQANSVQVLDRLVGGGSGWLGVAALFLVIGAPLTEELLVRGALWGALEHYRVNRFAILALTALVFAFLHQEPQLTVALFCQGVAIGTARMMTGRIGASMIAHATNNLIPALLLLALG